MSIRVHRPGLLTTLQDLGRRAQRHGVVRGGAMDRRAARVANVLVGNPEGDAVLECTVRGPTLDFERPHLVALAGADLGATLDGAAIPVGRPFAAMAGARLSFASRPGSGGCRAYIGVAGGIDVPRVIGSRGTDLTARIGGLDGRALQAQDVLDVGRRSAWADHALEVLGSRTVAAWGAARSLLHRRSECAAVRIIEGREHAAFSESSRAQLTSATFTVTAQSNRMGYRLEGARLELETPLELVSSPVATGTVQVPPSGAPIVLMADAQTVGGYPRIAHVITADLPVLAQVRPGGALRFDMVTLDDALRACSEQEREIRMFSMAVRFR